MKKLEVKSGRRRKGLEAHKEGDGKAREQVCMLARNVPVGVCG